MHTTYKHQDTKVMTFISFVSAFIGTNQSLRQAYDYWQDQPGSYLLTEPQHQATAGGVFTLGHVAAAPGANYQRFALKWNATGDR